MNRSEFTIEIEFNDGTTATLGGDDELYVAPGEGNSSATLNDERLNLIRLVREAEIAATVAA